MEILKNNKYFWIGIAIGVLSPFFSILILYFLKFSYFPIIEYLKIIQVENTIINALFKVCLLFNIILFTLLLTFKKDDIAKGLFVCTALLGIIGMILK